MKIGLHPHRREQKDSTCLCENRVELTLTNLCLVPKYRTMEIVFVDLFLASLWYFCDIFCAGYLIVQPCYVTSGATDPVRRYFTDNPSCEYVQLHPLEIPIQGFSVIFLHAYLTFYTFCLSVIFLVIPIFCFTM